MAQKESSTKLDSFSKIIQSVSVIIAAFGALFIYFEYSHTTKRDLITRLDDLQRDSISTVQWHVENQREINSTLQDFKIRLLEIKQQNSLSIMEAENNLIEIQRKFKYDGKLSQLNNTEQLYSNVIFHAFQIANYDPNNGLFEDSFSELLKSYGLMRLNSASVIFENFNQLIQSTGFLKKLYSLATPLDTILNNINYLGIQLYIDPYETISRPRLSYVIPPEVIKINRSIINSLDKALKTYQNQQDFFNYQKSEMRNTDKCFASFELKFSEFHSNYYAFSLDLIKYYNGIIDEGSNKELMFKFFENNLKSQNRVLLNLGANIQSEILRNKILIGEIAESLSNSLLNQKNKYLDI